MKKIILLLLGILCYSNLFSQNSTSTQFPVPETYDYWNIGFVNDSRSSFSINAGYGKTKESAATLGVFSYYHINSKYNFTENAVSLRGSVGYGRFFLGGKFTIDTEYNIDSEQIDLFLIPSAGLDFFGIFSLMIGPSFNITQNNSNKFTTLNVGFSIAPGQLIETGFPQKKSR